MTDDLVRERHGNVLLLRINRPDARNALNGAVMGGLGAAIIEGESDPEIRALVVTGTGDKAFSAGMDLREFSEGGGPPVDEAEMAAFLRLLHGEAGVPTVGAAQAPAVGGGLEVLLGCDVIVASSEARFGLPEVKRGLFPGGGGTAVGRRVPLGIAYEMLLTGDPISAARAYEVGLVNAIVPAAEVQSAALALAERIAANAPLGLAACKELGRLAVTDSARYAERVAHWRGIVFSSEDAKEGSTAFVEKRAPVWQGR